MANFSNCTSAKLILKVGKVPDITPRRFTESAILKLSIFGTILLPSQNNICLGPCVSKFYNV